MLLVESPPSFSDFQFFSPPTFRARVGKKRPIAGPPPFQSPKHPTKKVDRPRNVTSSSKEQRKHEEVTQKKRKRGYFPYTEDTDYVSSVDTPVTDQPQATVSPKRVFHDYIPWYRWGRHSFVLPHERARGYRCPDTDSEPENRPDDSKVSKSSSAEPEQEPVITTPLRARASPKTPTQLAIICPNCRNIQDPGLLIKAKELLTLSAPSGIEKLSIEGIDMIYDCAGWLKTAFVELKYGLLAGYRLLTDNSMQNEDGNSSRKRQKTVGGAAIIPRDAQWPPCIRGVNPTSHITDTPLGTRETRPREKLVPRSVKQYINARFDDFLAEHTARRKCVLSI